MLPIPLAGRLRALSMASYGCLLPYSPTSVIDGVRPNAEAALVRSSNPRTRSSLASSHWGYKWSCTCCMSENSTGMNIAKHARPLIARLAPCRVVKVPPRGTGTRLCHHHTNTIVYSVPTMRRARCQITKNPVSDGPCTTASAVPTCPYTLQQPR